MIFGVPSASQRFSWASRAMRRLGAFALAVALTAAATAFAADPARRTFASPDEAAYALVDALGRSDADAAAAILGPAGEKLIRSGDAVADQNALLRFLAADAKRHRLAQEGGARAILHVGEEDWPLPIPIVRRNGAWFFDTAAAMGEILNRRIGRNELNAIQVCLGIVDAQREYASTDHDGSGLRTYARRFVSTPGMRDGLYWKAAQGEPQSPLGPMVARAVEEGYHRSSAAPGPIPYHGYYYRILTAQGKHAKGGAYGYIVNGKMMGGFGLIAYPARYGASGIMTFVVNQDGAVYQRNLGRASATIARSMRAFDPDSSWRAVTTAEGRIR